MLFPSFNWQLVTGSRQLAPAATVTVRLFGLLLIANGLSAALAAAHPPVPQQQQLSSLPVFWLIAFANS
jgi:hypothetical protein